MKRGVSLTRFLRAVVLALSFAIIGSAASAQAQLTITAAEARAAVNGLRAAAGLGSLDNDPLLMALATQQAVAMATASTMSHTVAGSLQQRLATGGYGIRAAGENIAYGQPTLDVVFASWMQSPPHRANILDPRMTAFGLGAATVNGVTYWALIVAVPL